MDTTITRIDESRCTGDYRHVCEIDRFDHWDAAPAVMIWPSMSPAVTGPEESLA